MNERLERDALLYIIRSYTNERAVSGEGGTFRVASFSVLNSNASLWWESDRDRYRLNVDFPAMRIKIEQCYSTLEKAVDGFMAAINA
jgi:hypothetical protein